MKRPEDRLGSGNLGVYEIRNHALFRNVDWKKLEARQVTPPVKPTISADTPVFDYGLSSITRSGEGTDISLSRSQGLFRSHGNQPRATNESGGGFMGAQRGFMANDFASPVKPEQHSDSLVSDKSNSHSINGLDSLLSAIEKKRPEAATSSVLDNIVDSISTHSQHHHKKR
eukprot:TRINITY_DN12472_c0_g1_i2.p1 TRINITY_DN12472_c0_g1~~TRINITY_DN12472_c0_g1_i2.p1  ORF type:complete len:171 (-),score=32.15 TRINITY_DN12472_c0_g1_i2:28-540(-)